ncbi:MAG: substrate-binding domain-containing protein [Candidatus Latescibacteria bacterium]|nr:substrate-binding domain-containing protein [Candidatus Latescibacterota bacterium]
MRKISLIICCAFFVSFLSCGCDSSKKSGEKFTIAVIPMGTTHEFWKSIHAGALTAAQELGGVDIIWKGPLKEDDREEQIQIVETFIAADVDAIVLSPMDDRALIRPVREAKDFGIPTVLVNSGLQGDYHVSYVATENYNGGVLGAEYIGKTLNGKGKLILVRVSEADATTIQREAGFLDTIKSKFPGIEILSDNQYAGVTTETAYRTCENLLNRYSKVEVIFTPNESSTFGCLRALQDRGLAGKIMFVGFDSTEKLIEAMKTREIQGLVIQNPFNMGYYGVKTTVAYLRNEPYEKRVDTGVLLATPENMNNPEIIKLLSPDLSILE